MKYLVITVKPTVSRLDFEETHSRISTAWEKKAQALQARRWHALRIAESKQFIHH